MVKGSLTNLAGSAQGAATNALRDIKPPVHIASGWEWVWWILSALVLAGAAFLAWRFWKQRRRRVPPPVIVPAHIRARRELEQALAYIGSPKEFCILVSDIIRWYLEERFQFRAPERTTEEFLHELAGTDLLSSAQKLSLATFLEKCDLVKFAKYEPGEPELRDLHGSAVRLVEETAPLPSPTATGGADTARAVTSQSSAA